MQRYQQQYKALGSEALLTLVSNEDKKYIDKLIDELHGQINEFEFQFSRFLPDSELTKFNESAGSKVPISKSFKNLLIECKSLSELTNGTYNPFILPKLQSVGYVNSWIEHEKKLPTLDYSNRDLVNIDSLIIGSDWAQIPKNTALDFGGIGKGYLLDELSNKLSKAKLAGYWISLGGDIICAGKDLDEKDWEIKVQNAINLSEFVDTISNKDGKLLAIATSGVTKRKGIHNNKEWHHLIDPKTGLSASTNILTVTVTSKKAVTADVIAKCVVIDGEKSATIYEKQDLIDLYIVQTISSKDTMRVG